MFSTKRVINCPNPECDQPLNCVGDTICDRCHTPLIYRYLWATGNQAAEISPETKVANRYEVIKPQIWLDTQPALLPDIPAELPNIVIPYLRLYSEHLHIPQAYGFTSLAEIEDDILVLSKEGKYEYLQNYHVYLFKKDFYDYADDIEENNIMSI